MSVRRIVTFAFLLSSAILPLLLPRQVTYANITSSIIHVPAQYPTIQAAIDAAIPGDQILVSSGTFSSFTVSKEDLQIVGENKLSTIINLGSSTIRILAENTTVHNFTIRNSIFPYAMYVESSWNKISNNIFESNVGGIQCGQDYSVREIGNNQISANAFRNSSRMGLRLYNTSQNLILANNFSANYWCISVWEGSADNLVDRNILQGTQAIGINVQNSPRTVVSNNYIESGNAGIYVDINSEDTIVSANTLINLQGELWGKIYLIRCENVTVSDNLILNSTAGIYLDHATNAVLFNNTMKGNKYGLGIHGDELPQFVHNIDSSNTINTKPVFYMLNCYNDTVNAQLFPEAGYLAIVNSTQVLVKDIRVSNNWQGILLAYTTDSVLENVTSLENKSGIDFYQCSNNTLVYSNLVNNTYGLRLMPQSTAKIYKNNFVNNTNKPQCSLPSTWDNGAEGNFWGSFSGEDSNLDGIIDSPHSINSQNLDNFPLIEPFNESKTYYCGTWEQVPYYVTVHSKSTLASFEFEQGLRRISFNATGPSGAAGACLVEIPEQFLGGNYTVEVSDIPVSFQVSFNGSHNCVSFAFNNTTHNIEIYGTTVIPEFHLPVPISLIILALMSVYMLLIFRRAKRLTTSAFPACSPFAP